MSKLYDAWGLLEEISYERISGSQKEKDTAAILLRECEKLGVEAHLEEFEVDHSEVKKEYFSADGVEYNVTCVQMSGNTNGPLTKEFYYAESVYDVNKAYMKDKIVLVNDYVNVDVYKKLCEAEVAGYITTSGSVYDDINNTDLEEKKIRERQYSVKKIPGVTMRIIDAEKLVRQNPKMATIEIAQEESKAISQNVVATIKGEIEDEICSFTAHYDSVRFSTGAYDNGSGAVTIMDCLAYYKANKPRRTLKFIFCGSEEVGLMGSKAYVAAHKDDMDKYLFSFNVDMTGVVLGKDIACITGEMSAVNYFDYFAKLNGFPLRAYQGVYSSDSTPFADQNVPSVSFCRASANGGATIHSRRDVITYMSRESLDKTTDFIINISSSLINCHTFPVPHEMPENMRKDLDKYLGKNQETK